ncbi:unnamed protein product [Vitrella brassicaformis CCMP3155]|uniref:Large ribosomal subunit protein mL49 n=2 Tax=Vitrella brassicaformis TaxID=1169539 RepID=A0A0G4FC24_VITBC|nr:unnamed protein product [Vitrella brassicaformis CCMP3155]|eukprot:CEM10181.1 unnamed protein product [Vitrella brassicaformis CCMP3155]
MGRAASPSPVLLPAPCRTHIGRPTHRCFGVWREAYENERRKIDAAPFAVERTMSDKLPIYLKRERNGTFVYTILRKIRGHKETFMKELAFVCGVREEEVRERGNWIVINGNHRAKLRMWLQGLGF